VRRPLPGAPLGVRLAATLFLVGEVAPVAPATMASLLVAPFFYPLLAAPGFVQLLVAGVLVAIAIPVSTRAERWYGHDASAIVIDEVAGMAVTFAVLPPPASGQEIWVLGAGFLLFRVFDVLKPFPANRAQNLPAGRGVVLDDVVAGIYANVCLQLWLWLG
jgi:phosphatidylglycerophosphatase A